MFLCLFFVIFANVMNKEGHVVILSLASNVDAKENLEAASHPHEIKRGRFVNLNIDQNVHGVGGVDTWGQPTLPQYTIDGNKPYHYAILLDWI